MPLSSESVRALRFLADAPYSVAENALPAWLSVDRLSLLVGLGYVQPLTLVPPGKESEFPRGLVGYAITPAGLDALEESERLAQNAAQQAAQKISDQNAAQHREAKKERANWARFWLGLFLGWLLGSVSPFNLWEAVSRFLLNLFAHLR